MTLAWFILQLQDDPQYFFMVVLAVVISIVLHELAHGVAAVWQGDDTPIVSGHMTLNPVVHMGWFSLIMLVCVGFAYGQMPVSPHRFRSRYGDALVSIAGPVSNLLLALIALTAFGLWLRFGSLPDTPFLQNVLKFLLLFGTLNVLLCIFNMIPLPPLDGSHILANFHDGYANVISNPQHQQLFMFLFIGIFFIAGALFDVADQIVGAYLSLFAI